jgi:flagellar hook-associated protein 3 FlgL
LRYDQVQHRVETAKAQNARELDRLATQKDILNLSDDPIGAKQAIRLRDSLSDTTQFQKNIDYSKGMIERSEAALNGISDNLIRAKELAVAMSNDTYDQSSKEATAREVREIMEEIVQLGNTTFNGRYIFSGFRNQTPPLNLEGDYMGDDGALFLQVSRGNFRQVNLQARQLFEASADDRAQGHYNMLTVMEVFYEGLMSGSKDSIHKALAELDFQLEKTSSHQATLGGMWRALSDTGTRLESESEMTKKQLSSVEDSDMYDATSEFKRTETALQSTLQASTKLLQPSLFNFMQ